MQGQYSKGESSLLRPDIGSGGFAVAFFATSSVGCWCAKPWGKDGTDLVIDLALSHWRGGVARKYWGKTAVALRRDGVGASETE